MLYGPMIETQRVNIPGTQTYVEIRSEFHANTAWYGYSIETGHVVYGHRGTWGRDNIREAVTCFADAIEYAATHHIRSHCCTQSLLTPGAHSTRCRNYSA